VENINISGIIVGFDDLVESESGVLVQTILNTTQNLVNFATNLEDIALNTFQNATMYAEVAFNVIRSI
jgi:hypothetical protein